MPILDQDCSLPAANLQSRAELDADRPDGITLADSARRRRVRRLGALATTEFVEPSG
jgi:hypothetical protein